MLAKKLYDFRTELEKEGIVFCYSGFLTEGVLSGMGNSIKQMLVNEGTDRKVTRSLFAIFVEQAQNVIRYSAEAAVAEEDAALELRYGVITMGKTNDKYFVSCGNLIKQADVSDIGDALSHIQTLDRTGLKDLHKKILKGETPEGSKGAGVGFVEIARSAREGFEFDFEKVDEDHSYFCLKAFL